MILDNRKYKLQSKIVLHVPRDTMKIIRNKNILKEIFACRRSPAVQYSERSRH